MLYLVYSPFLIMTDKDQKEKSVGGWITKCFLVRLIIHAHLPEKLGTQECEKQGQTIFKLTILTF